MWKTIDGYYWPYRIDEEAHVERQRESGEWTPLSSFISRTNGGGYGRLCVRLRMPDGRYKNVFVKNLMVVTFMGGRRPGTVVGLRNGMIGDCSLNNLYFTTQKQISSKTGGASRRPIEKVDREGNVVGLYASMVEAAQKNYISRKSVWVRCKNRLQDPFALDGFNYRYER